MIGNQENFFSNRKYKSFKTFTVLNRFLKEFPKTISTYALFKNFMQKRVLYFSIWFIESWRTGSDHKIFQTLLWSDSDSMSRRLAVV